MSNTLEFINIYPKINVYKNVFKDVDDFLKKAKTLKSWEPWYTFGDMISLRENILTFDYFPSKEEYLNHNPLEINKDDEQELTNNILCKEVSEIFYDVTKHFLEMHPDTSLINYIKQSASINRYIPEGGVSENYSMNYHTDFVVAEKDSPGYKFGITTTFYLNDNYDSGEICFKINDDYISYKPQAGDVIVFPSKDPYMHAVRKAYGNDRYMIRSFWQFYYSGSKSWLENESKYGKKTWEEMEKERIDKEKFNYQIDGESVNSFYSKDNGKYL